VCYNLSESRDGMNKIILIVWIVCVVLLIVIFGNKSNKNKFIKYWKENIEKTKYNKKFTLVSNEKQNTIDDKKIPLYQLIIYYIYIFIVLAIFIIGPFFIQAILVAIKEYLYVPEDVIIIYNSDIEYLLYFAGMIMLAPIIMLIDLVVNRGFLLEIDRRKMKFSAKDDGTVINVIMPIICVVIVVPLLFLGLNQYRYCTEEKIVIKTVFSKEKKYNYEDIKYVVRHEYNVDVDATEEEFNERFDYKVFFKDGTNYKISDSTLFEKEIINKKNIRMELDD